MTEKKLSMAAQCEKDVMSIISRTMKHPAARFSHYDFARLVETKGYINKNISEALDRLAKKQLIVRTDETVKRRKGGSPSPIYKPQFDKTVKVKTIYQVRKEQDEVDNIANMIQLKISEILDWMTKMRLTANVEVSRNQQRPQHDE